MKQEKGKISRKQKIIIIIIVNEILAVIIKTPNRPLVNIFKLRHYLENRIKKYRRYSSIKHKKEEENNAYKSVRNNPIGKKHTLASNRGRNKYLRLIN